MNSKLPSFKRKRLPLMGRKGRDSGAPAGGGAGAPQVIIS